MNQIFLGNLFALIGSLIMVGSGILKTRKQILLVQCVQFIFNGLANLVLGGVDGAITSLVGIVRNFVSLKYELTTPLKLLFIAAMVGLSLFANTAGYLGILPILSASIYTWFLDVKDERKLKAIIIFTVSFWIVYDFSLCNYVAVAFDTFTVVSNIIGIVLVEKDRKNKQES